jgi:uroporphyrinogen-III synthase
MVLLVLRPEPQASDMVAALSARGVTALAEPMLAIEALDDPAGRVRAADPEAEAIILTSRQTVAILKAAGDLGTLINMPVIAVGGGTAHDARAAGFVDVRSADGNADDLVDLVARAGFHRLVHAGGRDKAGDIAGRLAALGVTVTEAELYRAEQRDQLAPEVATAFAEGRIDGLIVASRRSSQAFVNLVESMDLTARLAPLKVAALSEAAAAPFTGRVADILVAASPTGPALIEASVALAARLGETASGTAADDIRSPAGGNEEAEGPLTMASDDHRDGTDAKAGKRNRPKAPVIDLEAKEVAKPVEAKPEPAAPEAAPAETPASEPAAEAPKVEAAPEAEAPAADKAEEPAAPAAAIPPRTDRPGQIKAFLPLLAAAILGSAVTVGAMLVILPQGQGTADVAAVDPAALEARLGEVADRLANSQTTAEALAARIGALESTEAPTVDLGPLQASLADIGKRLDKAESDIGRVSETPAVDPKVIADLAAAVSALRNDGASLSSRLAGVEERIAKAPKGGEIASLSLALTSLSGKIDAGLPFAADLAVVKAAAPDLDGLAALETFATTGVATRDKLIADLPVEAMLARRPVEAGSGWFDSLTSSAKALVNYRETGDGTVDPASTAVEAIRAALARGDAAAAKAAAATLPDWAREPAAGWFASLDARVAADAAVRALTDRVVDRLSVPAAN